jgi:membrane protein YdbS with pleckstrin-like domain
VTTDPFAVPGWVRVSPALIRARRISLLLGYLLVLAAVVTLWLLPGVPRWVAVVVTVAAVVVFAWAWWLIGRRVRSWGYALRPEDLLVGSGILFRRLVIVPYGRMLFDDAAASAIYTWGDTVSLHDAPPAELLGAAIPGLVPDVAADRRARRARLGEQRQAGL